MEFIVFAQGDPFVKNAYLEKLSLVMERSGLSHVFWVWNRDGTVSESERVKVLLELPFGGWGRSSLSALGYMLWMAVVFFFAAKGCSRNRVFVCSRFDTALPVAVASLIFRNRFVFLDRDTFSKSYRWPYPLKQIFEWMESCIGRRSELHIVPGYSRVQCAAENIRVVQNTPHSELLAAARTVKRFRDRDPAVLRVCVSGLISPQRGSEWLLEVVRSLERVDTVRFVMAGRLVGGAAHELTNCANVSYLGVLQNIEALALLRNSDLAVAFYDPTIEINRLAEPNKWFDCAALGVPFISNHGLETLQPFLDCSGCFSVEYGDVDGLAGMLLELCRDRGELVSVGVALAKMKFSPWDAQMREILAEIK